MTWRHYKSRTKNGLLYGEWYFCDLDFAHFLIIWYAESPYWKLSLSCKGDDFDDLANRRFDSAEEAMTAVEERLASMAQDLLSDALGVRRIQEAK